MSKADMIQVLEAERDDLVDSPGDGHPERVAEIAEQLKSLGEDSGDWAKRRKAERDALNDEVDTIRAYAGDSAADHSAAAQRVAKLDAHLPAKAAKHG
jgi:hypothetical protein